tara:strand:- start:785 stop:1033 length:249 start_codon:yes stop_codon:yes gene_type:complete
MNQNNQNNQDNEVGFHEREFFVKEMVKAEKENEELKKKVEELLNELHSHYRCRWCGYKYELDGEEFTKKEGDDDWECGDPCR